MACRTEELAESFQVNQVGSTFIFLLNDVISILKPVDQTITSPRIITLHHFPLYNHAYNDNEIIMNDNEIILFGHKKTVKF